MRKRIDRFIEDALVEFIDWFHDTEWVGKERDAVNMFAMGFLAKRVQPGAAIYDLRQIRIESPVPQLVNHRNKPAVAKDLLIWKEPLMTAWNSDYNPVNVPWVILEWKFKRKGRNPNWFDDYDANWLSDFTLQNPGTFAYLVQLYAGKESRDVLWAKVKDGEVKIANRRS